MFSNSTKYAIRAIVHIMENEAHTRDTVVRMAKDLKIPQPYLSKVLQQLARSGIISSAKGRGGGFFLTEENRKRPLIDVVVCIEGYNVFNKCILGLEICSDDNPCILHDQFKAFKVSIEDSVSRQSINDLFKLI